jgi:glycosyltransferase involved in cell wall biosynthesis
MAILEKINKIQTDNFKPRLLVISRWQKLPKGFSRICNDLYSTNIWQKEFDVIHYATQRPLNLKECVEEHDIITISATSEEKQLFLLLQSLRPDIVLYIGDVFNLLPYESVLNSYSGIKIAYLFLDAENIPFTWNKILKSFHILVSATEFGTKELKKFDINNSLSKDVLNIEENILTINPPINQDIFKLIKYEKKEGLKTFNKINPKDFLLLNIFENMPRKGLWYSIELLSRLQKITKETRKNNKIKLILHTNIEKHEIESLRYFDLEEDSIILTEKKDNIKDLLSLYYLADLTINTSVSEGWGLPITESLLCGTPVIAPSHSGCFGATGQEVPELKKDVENMFLYNVEDPKIYMYNTNSVMFCKVPNVMNAAKKAYKYVESFYKDQKYILQARNLGVLRSSYIFKEKIAQEWLDLFLKLKRESSFDRKENLEVKLMNINFIRI